MKFFNNSYFLGLLGVKMVVIASEPTASDPSWEQIKFINGFASSSEVPSTANDNDLWSHAFTNLQSTKPSEPYDDQVSWYDSSNTGEFPCWVSNSEYEPNVIYQFDLRGKTGPTVLIKEFYLLTSNVPADANKIGNLKIGLAALDY